MPFNEPGAPKALPKQETTENESAAILEIEEMRGHLKVLLEKLRPDIEKGSYGIIVGDDASGRLPALVLWNVLKHVYKDKEFPPPQLRFVAGSRRANNPKLKAQLLIEKTEELKAELGNSKKVLIVTETISTGSALTPLIDALKQVSIEFKIATLTKIYTSRSISSTILEEELIIGYDDADLPKIFNQEVLSGVTKRPDNLHAWPYTRRNELPKETNIPNANDYDPSYVAPDPEEVRKQEQNQINLARKNIFNLSDELYGWYTTKKES